MVDLTNIKKFVVARPEGWTLFGNGAAFDQLPETHQAQILFLDNTASKYIWDFSSNAHLLTGGGWAPFEKGNFKTVEEFTDFRRTDESKRLLKKWLYNRGIAFDTWVFLLEDGNDQAILTTWKMVIKYSADLFIMSDMMIFDNTLNWCLYFFHEDKLFFGKDNVYDITEDHQRMEALNERKKNFPQFKHPFL